MWISFLKGLPDLEAEDVANHILPRLSRQILDYHLECKPSKFIDALTVYDALETYSNHAMRPSLQKELVEAVFEDKRLYPSTYSSAIEKEYSQRLSCLQVRAEEYESAALDELYAKYAKAFLTSIVEGREVKKLLVKPLASDKINYSYPAPICDCGECNATLRKFLPDRKRLSVTHIGNEQGRKHIIATASKSGRLETSTNRVGGRIQLTLVKRVSARARSVGRR